MAPAFTSWRVVCEDRRSLTYPVVTLDCGPPQAQQCEAPSYSFTCVPADRVGPQQALELLTRLLFFFFERHVNTEILVYFMGFRPLLSVIFLMLDLFGSP